MHNGWVEVEGVKMSKSLNNFTSLTDLLEQTGDGRTYRLLVLRAHYRSPTEVTAETIRDAAAALERLDALRDAASRPRAPPRRTRRRSSASSSAWTTTSTRPPSWPTCSTSCAAANTAADAGDDARRRRSRGGRLRDHRRVSGWFCERDADDVDDATAR